MKKSKILAAVVAAAVLSVSGGVLAGCGSEHTHTYSKDWKNDATGHWHVATCDDLKEGDKDYKSGYAEHVWGGDDECDVCKYKKTPDTPVETEYTVTLNAGDGTLTDSASLTTVNGKLSSLPTPTAPNGYWFTGWYTAATEGTKVDADYAFSGETKEVTIYAQYAQEVDITLEVGDGTLPEGTQTTLKTVNGKVTLPKATISTENWHFAGWYDAAEGGNKVDSTNVYTQGTKLFARFVRNDGIWVGDNLTHTLVTNTGADHVQYWLGADERIELEKDTEVSIYMGGKLISFWISGSCVDTSKSSVEKVPSAIVTKKASFVIYLNDYSSESNPDNWTCEFLGAAIVTETTAELPDGCKGVEITVGEGKITLYIVTPDGKVVNESTAHNYQIYAWDGVKVDGVDSTEPFGAWTTNPTLNTAITAQCGIAAMTQIKLHWTGGESSAFAGLETGKAYVVKVTNKDAGDCEVKLYTGEADILTPYTPEENPDVDPSIDARDFFIKGAGKSPDLDGWGPGTKLTKAEDKNEYTIKLDLYVGDLFKFATADWSAQFGPSSIEKEFEGVAHFADSSNIECLVEGNYTFTITTKHSDGTPDSVTWVRNGAVEGQVAETVTHFYIKGTAVEGGWGVPASSTTELTAKEGEEGVYEKSFELVAGALMFYSKEVDEAGNVSNGTAEIKDAHIDEASRGVVGTSTDGNIIIENAGTYTFKYDSSTKKVTITFTPKVTEEVPGGEEV